MSSHTPSRPGRGVWKQRTYGTGLRAHLRAAFGAKRSLVVIACDECRQARPGHEVLVIGDSALCVDCATS